MGGKGGKGGRGPGGMQFVFGGPGMGPRRDGMDRGVWTASMEAMLPTFNSAIMKLCSQIF